MTTLPWSQVKEHKESRQGSVLLGLARQEFRDSLFSWGPYLTAALAVLLAVLLVYNSIRFVGESGLSIISRPFFTPLLMATSLALLYVTVNATLALARPREQGALMVLFFAPVDEATVVVSQWLAGTALYVLILGLLLPPLFLLVLLTNFVLPPPLVWGLIPMLLVGGLAVAFGLFVSAFAPSGRAAVLFLIAITLLLLAIEVGYAALLNIPPTSRYYDALIFARVALRNVQNLLFWLSPFRMLDQGLSAVLRGDGMVLIRVVFSAVVGTCAWLGAAIWALRRRGVLP